MFKKIIERGYMRFQKHRIIAALTAFALAGCTVGGPNAATVQKNEQKKNEDYLIGVIQFAVHPALDEATRGFVDELKENLNLEDKNFDIQIAAGDSATCTTIANALVSENCDIILANATASLQAASSATTSIPILGTAVTEYGIALGMENFDGTTGINVSGTADLAPLDQQVSLFDELIPNAQNIGILYCSAEANSVYQATEVKKRLEAKGKNVSFYTFADTNDVSQVTQNACLENDALYIPTDNTAASCTETIDNIASIHQIPIITGDNLVMKTCGIATVSIDYYDLGRTTGKMAARILKRKDKIEEMPIEYCENTNKEYNPERCQKLGITVPDSKK